MAALIPPPRFNMVRYHGVLAARAKVRSEVVPGPTAESSEPVQLHLVLEGDPRPDELEARPESRHPWAWLLQRVFAVDVLTCSRCRGRMGLVKVANTPAGAAQVLAELGLAPRPPPRQLPTLPGQLELDLAAA